MSITGSTKVRVPRLSTPPQPGSSINHVHLWLYLSSLLEHRPIRIHQTNVSIETRPSAPNVQSCYLANLRRTHSAEHLQPNSALNQVAEHEDWLLPVFSQNMCLSSSDNWIFSCRRVGNRGSNALSLAVLCWKNVKDCSPTMRRKGNVWP